MSAKLIDGRAVSQRCIEQVTLAVRQRRENGLRVPGLAVVLVGDDPASAVYVRNKNAACEKAGFQSFSYHLGADTTEEELVALVDSLNANPEVDGILVQLPLPPQIRSQNIIERIRPDKDADGFHPYNVGRLAVRLPLLRPCTPKGVMTLLEAEGVAVKGMKTLVVGASNIVGRPMALELMLAGATVTVCHRFTANLAEEVAAADLVVVAVGKPGIVRGEWVRPGAVVVDVGIKRMEDGSLRGDVDFEAAKARAALITPVPGGVGPMTIASLLENTLQAAEDHDRAQAA